MEALLTPYRIASPVTASLWCVPLAAVTDWPLARCLPAEELARLPLHGPSRLRSLAGQALMRGIVAERIGQAPAALALVRGEQGKPFLPDQPWHFNWAHSGDYVLLGVARQPVGVDLERVDLARNRAALLRRVASPEEVLWVGSSAEHFFRLWCAKEACLKTLGLGLAQLAQVRLHLEHERFTAVLATTELEGQWVSLPEGYAGALAF